MVAFVIGGSGSGKSSYAEEAAGLLSITGQASGKQMRKYYLATMQASGQEEYQKVERHRRSRRGKGFHTIEQPFAIYRALEKMERGENVVLLECVSNLTANEMFFEEEPRSAVQTAEAVIRGIRQLIANTAHLVLVSNNVFEDGTVYDNAVMEYIHAMGKVNQTLLELSDLAVETVVGIPVILKQERGSQIAGSEILFSGGFHVF